jgi:uncharacterized protein YdcH (DUF465 family)
MARWDLEIGPRRIAVMGHDWSRLEEDFPAQRQRIESLNASDGHFARLLEKYRDLDQDIHRLETILDPDLDDELEQLKRRRLLLKDEIAAMIASDR